MRFGFNTHVGEAVRAEEQMQCTVRWYGWSVCLLSAGWWWGWSRFSKAFKSPVENDLIAWPLALWQ